jgi:hypothetical protein
VWLVTPVGRCPRCKQQPQQQQQGVRAAGRRLQQALRPSDCAVGEPGVDNTPGAYCTHHTLPTHHTPCLHTHLPTHHGGRRLPAKHWPQHTEQIARHGQGAAPLSTPFPSTHTTHRGRHPLPCCSWDLVIPGQPLAAGCSQVFAHTHTPPRPAAGCVLEHGHLMSVL